MQRHVLLVLAAGLLLGADQANDADPKIAKSDYQLIQGTWDVVDCRTLGNLRDDTFEYRYVFADDKCIFLDKRKDDARSWNDAASTAEYRFELNPQSEPKTIDLIMNFGQRVKGIYELNGDRLKIHITRGHRAERPTTFESILDSKFYEFMTLKRLDPETTKAEAAADVKQLVGTWKLAAWQRAGNNTFARLDFSIQYTFEEDGVIKYKYGEKEDKGTYTLNTSLHPKWMDLTKEAEGYFMMCVYEIDGDELRICTAHMWGWERPNALISQNGTRNFSLMTFRRVKPEEAESK